MTNNKLTEDVGNIIWYRGFTLTFDWDCPAEITQVDQAARTFRVKSLDDMLEQSQNYTFDTDVTSPNSRLTMYVPDPKDVRWFLNARIHRINQKIVRIQESLAKKEAEAKRFTDYLSRNDLQPVSS